MGLLQGAFFVAVPIGLFNALGHVEEGLALAEVEAGDGSLGDVREKMGVFGGAVVVDLLGEIGGVVVGPELAEENFSIAEGVFGCGKIGVFEVFVEGGF